MKNYTTKKEILENKVKIRDKIWKQIIETTLDWKEWYYKDWKTFNPSKKTFHIAILIGRIQAITDNKAKYKLSNRYCYSPEKDTIYLIEDKPSIISSLHELGHAILGESELEACTFSVKLFKECFDTEYNKLVWQGHMLKKPTRKKYTETG